MKSPVAIVALLSLGLVANRVSAIDESARVNGWYQCAYSTTVADANATSLEDMAVFECAELEVPLCYDGVCKSDRMINLFVKRRLGKSESKDPSVPRKAGIMLQGGPGMSSVVIEGMMEGFVDPDEDTIDFYTFDQRGVGRSEYLQCDAASALTPGSPHGVGLSTDEMAACIEDLNVQYDGQAAAFSTTSAAMDIRSIIDTFLSDHDVYIMGYSYGTYLAQRVMQLKVPQVKGYVLDGVDVVATKDDPYGRPYSNWEGWTVAPSRRLMEFCFDDPECPLKLASRATALEDVIELLDQIDAEPNECARIVDHHDPSVKLRNYIYQNGMNPMTVAAGLELLGHIQRCNTEDIATLKNSSATIAANAATSPPFDVLNGVSMVLYLLMVSSERFEHPLPTTEEMLKRVHATAAALSLSEIHHKYAAYCLFTGSTDPGCDEVLQEDGLTSNVTFFYVEHEYYEEPVTLPDDVAAILFTGGLDFQTPQELGEHLYEKLRDAGSHAMLVNFQYGGHTVGEATAEAPTTGCRDSLTRQFLQSGGDVAAIDLSCMAELPVARFHAKPEQKQP